MPREVARSVCVRSALCWAQAEFGVRTVAFGCVLEVAANAFWCRRELG